MRKLSLLILGLAVLVGASTFNLSAQTIGGDTSLSSKTWTWTGLSADFPSTTLFTPSIDSDFLITIYTTSTVNEGSGGQVCPTLTWTDEYGPETYVPSGGSILGGCSAVNSTIAAQAPGIVSFPIHVVAGNAVSISQAYNVPIFSPQPTYDFVVSKTKLNP